jgi:death-on-curing protein
MKYLIKKSFVLINRRTIDAHGGNRVPPENFLHESVIDYTIEAVKVSVFGKPMYPTLADKAAFYMFQIVTGHVFQDGNKRTGLEAALAFLQINGANLRNDLSSIEYGKGRFIPEYGENPEDILENFTIEMASGKITLDIARMWFEENIQRERELPSGIGGDWE